MTVRIQTTMQDLSGFIKVIGCLTDRA